MLVPENPLFKNTLNKTIERLSTYYSSSSIDMKLVVDLSRNTKIFK